MNNTNDYQQTSAKQKKTGGIKRSFDSTVVETDKFRQLPPKVQALYLHLQMNTDAYGFIPLAESITKGFCSQKLECLNRLIDEGYILRVSDNVYIMRHWRVNVNFDRKNDRPTQFQDEFKKIKLNEDTGMYELLQ